MQCPAMPSSVNQRMAAWDSRHATFNVSGEHRRWRGEAAPIEYGGEEGRQIDAEDERWWRHMVVISNSSSDDRQQRGEAAPTNGGEEGNNGRRRRRRETAASIDICGPHDRNV